MSSSVTRADVSSWQLWEVTTNPISSSPWRHNTTVKRPDREGGCNTLHSGPYPSYLKKEIYQHLIAGVTFQAVAGTLCTIWSEMWAVLEGWIVHSLGRALWKDKMLQEDNCVPALSYPSLTRKFWSCKSQPLFCSSPMLHWEGDFWCLEVVCALYCLFWLQRKPNDRRKLPTPDFVCWKESGGCLEDVGFGSSQFSKTHWALTGRGW